MTKELHLFSIGSAIVDVQLQIPHNDFETLGLTKGTMTLVDASTQKLLLDRFSDIEATMCSGGSAANTAIAFAQLGGKAGFGTMLGADDMGDFYASEFKHLGIHLVATVVEGESTGTCVVLVTPDAERTLNTALAVNSGYAAHHVSEDAIKNSEWLYFESYKLTDPICAEAIDTAIAYAKKHGTKIAVSFSDTFIVHVFGDQLRKVIAQADLVFCNRTEAHAFTGAEDPEEMFRLLKNTVPNVAMTLSEHGSHIAFDGKEYRVPAVPVTPVDATGAGDMYAAGFLYGITHGYTPDKAALLGSHAASKVISQMGARLSNHDIDVVRLAALG